MSNPLEELKQSFWINVYYSDNPKAPICTLELVNKQDKNERYKYPVWKDKEKVGFGFVGKLEEKKQASANNAQPDKYANSDFAKSSKHYEEKANGYQPDDNSDVPF